MGPAISNSLCGAGHFAICLRVLGFRPAQSVPAGPFLLDMAPPVNADEAMEGGMTQADCDTCPEALFVDAFADQLPAKTGANDTALALEQIAPNGKLVLERGASFEEINSATETLLGLSHGDDQILEKVMGKLAKNELAFEQHSASKVEEASGLCRGLISLKMPETGFPKTPLVYISGLHIHTLPPSPFLHLQIAP